MSTESNFDQEFEITREEAWLLYGVQNDEDWDTID
jgi:hypothetical protein